MTASCVALCVYVKAFLLQTFLHKHHLVEACHLNLSLYSNFIYQLINQLQGLFFLNPNLFLQIQFSNPPPHTLPVLACQFLRSFAYSHSDTEPKIQILNLFCPPGRSTIAAKTRSFFSPALKGWSAVFWGWLVWFFAVCLQCVKNMLKSLFNEQVWFL